MNIPLVFVVVYLIVFVVVLGVFQSYTGAGEEFRFFPVVRGTKNPQNVFLNEAWW